MSKIVKVEIVRYSKTLFEYKVNYSRHGLIGLEYGNVKQRCLFQSLYTALAKTPLYDFMVSMQSGYFCVKVTLDSGKVLPANIENIKSHEWLAIMWDSPQFDGKVLASSSALSANTAFKGLLYSLEYKLKWT